MVQLVPVSVRNSDTGKIWHARALTYSISGRGDTPKEALSDLKSKVRSALGGDPVELLVRSVNVTFPMSLTEEDFHQWVDRAEAASNAIR